MTFTSRIRVYLLLVAVLPSLAILAAIYFQTSKQIEQADHRRIQENLLQFERIQVILQSNLVQRVLSLRDAPFLMRTKALVRSGRADQIDLGHKPAGLDFMEVLDINYRVLASHHRPGLIGNLIKEDIHPLQRSMFLPVIATVEYDAEGVHAAWTLVDHLGDGLLLYTGQYVDEQYTSLMSEILEADIRCVFNDSARELRNRMESGQLYALNGQFRARLSGPLDDEFEVVADFQSQDPPPIFGTLLLLVGLVALLSVGVALVLGWYITGRARREITNLTNATARIADGDFDTAVMAYEEGEFSQLADAFTDMTIRLRNIRRELSTAEKIAAWQIMGRKIAHEIKNPLTPIAISTDDLRRSYNENLEDFPRILDETTGTIKTEVARLTTLLDQFVSFARMKPATPIDTSLKRLIADLTSLYRAETADGRLRIACDVTGDVVHLDPEAIGQVLINLVKNGLEAGSQSGVVVTIVDSGETLKVIITDTGPGFANEIIQAGIQPYLSTKKDGSGLGLVICERIVHDHGGTLEIGNLKKEGAEVTILLPQDDGKDTDH